MLDDIGDGGIWGDAEELFKGEGGERGVEGGWEFAAGFGDGAAGEESGAVGLGEGGEVGAGL